jgi:6-phosphogluconolactonase
MKWSQYGRITLALVASLALGLSITACNPSFTLGFIYTLGTKSTTGTINAYTIDSVSGALTQTANSPFSSGGQYPVANAVSNNSKWLYVVNEIDNSLVQFTIGTDGKLYTQATLNTPGTYPISMAIDSASKYLYVLDSYAPNINGAAPPNINPLQPPTTIPTAGCIAVYSISQTNGALTAVPQAGGAPCFSLPSSVGSQPIGITSTSFVPFVYVADQGTAKVYGFSVSNGQLTPVSTTNAGVKPSSIIGDATGRFLYVTDQYQNLILGYIINTDGSLSSQLHGPFATGLYPYDMAADPRGRFLYVTNYNSNSVIAYAIDAATGNPTQVSGGSGYGTGTGPTCITIEPSYGRFVYTANFVDGSVTGFKLDPSTGALTTNLNSPYPSSGQPVCVAAAANGTHPVQTITP